MSKNDLLILEIKENEVYVNKIINQTDLRGNSPLVLCILLRIKYVSLYYNI